jgi:hypothetical protein
VADARIAEDARQTTGHAVVAAILAVCCLSAAVAGVAVAMAVLGLVDLIGAF